MNRMKCMKQFLSLVLITCICTITLVGNPLPADASTWERDYSAGHLYYTSSSLVNSLNGDVSSISPLIDDSKIPYGTARYYLSDSGPLGIYGPFAPYGPLGINGPVGYNIWNPSYWISGWMDWSDWAEDMTGMGGPLSEKGPLGENGPLGNVYYDGVVFELNDFARHSRALGVWSPLGPIGPLGALGPLGPLGPIGAHGYKTNSHGEYMNNGQVVRNCTVWYNSARTVQRTYELYENYTEDFAKNMSDNDTSFMVEGTDNAFDRIDSYTFTSAQDQLVTLVVVNTNLAWVGDDYDIVVTDQNGNVLITSNGYANRVEWIQLKVPAGTTLNVEVKLVSPLAPLLFTSYRLFVTGSTQYLNMTEISGDHIAIWG